MKFIAFIMTCTLSYAGIEDSWLYREYLDRQNTKFSGIESSIISSLQLSGLKKEQIQKLVVEDNNRDFYFENLNDEKCSGSYTNNATSYTCASRWTEDEQIILEMVHKRYPKDLIFDLEIFASSQKFVFQTKNKEICHGTYNDLSTEVYCYTKAGVMSYFAGGDSD